MEPKSRPSFSDIVEYLSTVDPSKTDEEDSTGISKSKGENVEVNPYENAPSRN